VTEHCVDVHGVEVVLSVTCYAIHCVCCLRNISLIFWSSIFIESYVRCSAIVVCLSVCDPLKLRVNKVHFAESTYTT